ncbi:hypothetical protein FOCG_00687 [Fusarium oxysporum f. sp. radicis-lycopersici 26381]|uniref:Uncharacterized protein n=1 Tax=Fusarium oxysporum Fo47 TaxID=660027 RepID=W9KIZ1_FUSOX|nr:hypothetical protein FOZG_05186 [Fusarium oxysporum Fo47]EXL61700.1 hypothetical protein FOCG_00687 [Fusarium oxysporum f. sp. radicis-lycopersici 26381]
MQITKYRPGKQIGIEGMAWSSASKVPVWDLGSQAGIARQLMMA